MKPNTQLTSLEAADIMSLYQDPPLVEGEPTKKELIQLIKIRQEENLNQLLKIQDLENKLKLAESKREKAESLVSTLSNVIAELRVEKKGILELIRRMLSGYDGVQQIKEKAEDLLNREIGYIGAYHPSQKMSEGMLSDVRGGM